LRLLVFTQGQYGERILDNLKDRAPQGWEIGHSRLPENLPQILDDPQEVVSDLDFTGDWGLLLFLGESPSAFALLPAIVERSQAKAVIAPVDDYAWLPLGLERQIRSELEEVRVYAVFPRTFCTLSPVGDRLIDGFAQLFGSPRLEVETEGGMVTNVDVHRGAPCGSTWFMAEKLVGSGVEDAGAKAGTLVQIYPCLASRRVERLLGDAPIHIAGNIAKKAVEKALEEDERHRPI
jgi:hypothetical protein